MSRNVLLLMAVLAAGIAVLIALPKLRSKQGMATVPAEHAPAPAASLETATAEGVAPAKPVQPAPAIAPVVAAPAAGSGNTLPPGMERVTRNPLVPGQGTVGTAGANDAGATAESDIKPLPVLEKNYLATTNHEERLDILMDIADTPSSESVKALTRLFAAEGDPELKIDLLDSLLAIDGFKDEKLEMLKLGVQAGLPIEVRQSAIDGLIDLDDMRVVSVFNGLLNDPVEEIREAAKDALEMLQPEVPARK